MIAHYNSFKGFLKQIREDWFVNDESWFKPGFQAMAVYRFGVWHKSLPRLIRAPLSLLYKLLFIFTRNVYGIDLPCEASVGRRLRIKSRVVIHPHARIGDDCIIRQNVTIGAATRERWQDAPVLGQGVEVGVGAVIMGRVRIGDGVRIGPNAVVMTSVPAGATVFATASRIIEAPNARNAYEARAGVNSGEESLWLLILATMQCFGV